MKRDIPKMPIVIALILTCIAVNTSTKAQKLRCKLIYRDSMYVGGMKPDWFTNITLKPLTSDFRTIVGAKGTFYSNTFGNAGFSITKNKLNTHDSLMIRATFGWHPITRIEITKNVLSFDWDWSFRPDPVATDLEILDRADQILKEETMWDRNDDRDCEADSSNNKFSLYCAIHRATVEITGDFNHRGASLEIVRKTIRDTDPNRHYQHDLMDFNNKNSFAAIKSVLQLSRNNLQEKIRMGK